MEKFDIAILGGGPGGYVAAIRAAQLGKKVAIIDKDKLGGVCLNWGCIPTKALLKNAEVLHTVKNAKRFGIKINDYEVDFTATIKRSRQIADRLSKGVEYLMKQNGITYLVGRGKLKSANELTVTGKNKSQLVTADTILIATGARNRTFPGLETDGERVISSKEAMVLEAPPKKMVIIGAGAIGVEFAYFYNLFGTEVHVIEMLPRILPVEDEEVSKELDKNFKKSGLKIHTSTRVVRIEKTGDGVQVAIEKDGIEAIIEADYTLVAVGVTGNIEGIGLDKVGVNTDRGAIVVDGFGRTNITNIYAIGDVTGSPWLAHVASAQGRIAVEQAVGKNPAPLDLSNIPGCTYCQPQVASVGMTEQAAVEQGIEIKIGRFLFRNIGKSLAIGENAGFVKIIFERATGKLLGCHIIGAEATELIAELVVARALGATWFDLATTIHAHPTLSEAIMEAAADAYGEAIHQ
ncbi:MAG: dihydrolipoyl dehydrogenase [Candidatus Marinimicrobia bacterium]|nr:dihydrolipoyl dehydrogenase [Candidatus Neomarinimicrobiota bacterium]